ncbi:MAG TPA: M1 family aminopeptidase [Longimicrobiales bacterium]
MKRLAAVALTGLPLLLASTEPTDPNRAIASAGSHAPGTTDAAPQGAPPPAPDPAPGVSLTLAKHRSRTISELRYEVAFDVPATPEAPVRGRELIRFRLSDASAPVILDFRQPADHVRAVRVAGARTPYRLVNGHLVIPVAALREGENALEVEFIAGDGALNRNADFLYTLFVPDRASTAFPCFDQPDLKARYRLTLTIPAAWRAVANGALERRIEQDGRATLAFAETRPISTYLFAFAAGEFRVETAVRGGRRLRLFHRETDAEKVARNRDAIFDLHYRAIEWLETYTGIPYPFGKFDFVAIPAFQFGGMEHPGAILYNASSLFLDSSATQNQRLGRASVIAHETSHMWFGDLVTMKWFDDVWTKEVFANFMAAKIVDPSFPDVDHALRFFLAHYPAAYEVDRTAGANPIRQPLENLSDAGSLYGAIIYEKAPIVMRHLERLTGETMFRDGLREYLNTYAFGNATWPELIEILDRRSPEDLRAWSEAWVEEAGRPMITTELNLEGGRIASLVVRQSDPWGRGRVWSQRLHVLVAYPDTTRSFSVRLDGPSVRVMGANGLPAPDFVLADGLGIGYGHFRPDPASRAFLLGHLPELRDALRRGVAWVTLWDGMLEGDVAPAALIEVAAGMLETERAELNAQRVVRDLTEAYWRFLSAGERAEWAPRLEALLWRLIGEASTPSLKAVYFRAFRSIALSPAAVQRLERIWRKEMVVPGLPLAEEDYTDLALALAVREVDGWQEILDAQRERIENPDRRARFVFIQPALSADPATRDAFFASLADPANREHEAWVLEAVSYLHHPLRAEHAERYILPSLEMLEEIHRTGDIFFPGRWLDATLRGHATPSAAAIVRRYLRSHPELPPRLRGKLLQSADPLFRAAEVVGEGSDKG